ncbi:hypothetical protein D3C77_717750 [compost metagenome]
MVGHFANLHHVVRQPRHQMSCLGVIEKTEAQFLNMIEQFLAHICLDINSEHMSPIIDDIHQNRI